MNKRSDVYNISNSILKAIQKVDLNSHYNLVYYNEFLTQGLIDISVYCRKENDPNINDDVYFKSMPWEVHNLSKNGFVIDGYVYIEDDDFPYSDIEIYILITSKSDMKVLYHKIIDILFHELYHIEQGNIKDDPNELYFVRKSEIGPMVKGLYEYSLSMGIEINDAFKDYLEPYVKGFYINDAEHNYIISQWNDFLNKNSKLIL